MSRRLWLLPAFLAALAGGWLLGRAQAGESGVRYAFLVACSRYDKAEFRELPYTGNDVEHFRRALLATGFAADDIAVLRDGTDHPNRYLPNRANVLRELGLVLEGLRPQDTLLVALSGHGVQFKNDPVSYFVPVDGKVSDKRTLLPLNGPGGLYEQLKSCKAKKKLLLVNACRNDPTVSLDFATTKLELVDEDRAEVPEGIAAIYSCSAGQKSYYDPDRKVALFFEHAAKAWQGEYSGGEPVTLDRFFEQVRARTRSDAIKTLGRSQVPQVVREYQGEWVIAPPVLSRLVGVWEVVKGETDLPPGSTVEFTADGKLIMHVIEKGKADKLEGTYKVDGKKLTVTLVAGEKKLVETMTITTLTDTTLATVDRLNKKDEFKRKAGPR